jgi:hypothetical protein
VDDNLSLRDAVRNRGGGANSAPAVTTTPTSTSTPGSDAGDRAPRGRRTPGSPSGDDRRQPLTGDATTNQSANDGRAQNLNDGNHVGTRDTRIAALRERQQGLEAEETEIEGQIDDLEDEIESDEGKTSIVKTGVDIVTSPVTAVAGLFGRSNPISDAAGAATEHLLGLEGDRDQLRERESDLEDQQAEIEAEIKKLETEQVLNFLADTAHVVDMDDEVADFLEDGEQQVGNLNVRLRVADETGTGSDGVFDSGTNAITVDSEMVENARKTMSELQEAGIVDGDGNIVDAEGFDAAEAGDEVIKTVSLVGVHEVNHAAQHDRDEFESAFEMAEGIVGSAIANLAPDATSEQAEAVIGSAAVAGEAVRTRAIEVESYQLQEQNDLRSGAKKKAFITIDEQGAALPADQQLANVLAYQEGRPLEFGPTVGYVRESAGGNHEDHDHDGDGSTDGAHSHDEVADGFRGPGFRGPGFRGPGFEGEGFRGPGETADGFRGPGFRGPGFEAAGFRGPGETADGFRGPGFRGPGFEAAGYEADGFRGPGFRGPGYEADGLLAAGFFADGFRGPGFRGPGFEADGFRGPGFRGPGFRGPGYEADGFRGPGFRGPGHTAD